MGSVTIANNSHLSPTPFRSLKTEWMPGNGYQYFTEAEQDIAQYMKYYNHDRGHSVNGYLSPAQAEAA